VHAFALAFVVGHAVGSDAFIRCHAAAPPRLWEESFGIVLAIWIFVMALFPLDCRGLHHFVWTMPDGADDERIWQAQHVTLITKTASADMPIGNGCAAG
jgi:hypothetical protein